MSNQTNITIDYGDDDKKPKTTTKPKRKTTTRAKPRKAPAKKKRKTTRRAKPQVTTSETRTFYRPMPQPMPQPMPGQMGRPLPPPAPTSSNSRFRWILIIMAIVLLILILYFSGVFDSEEEASTNNANATDTAEDDDGGLGWWWLPIILLILIVLALGGMQAYWTFVLGRNGFMTDLRFWRWSQTTVDKATENLEDALAKKNDADENVENVRNNPNATPEDQQNAQNAFDDAEIAVEDAEDGLRTAIKEQQIIEKNETFELDLKKIKTAEELVEFVNQLEEFKTGRHKVLAEMEQNAPATHRYTLVVTDAFENLRGITNEKAQDFLDKFKRDNESNKAEDLLKRAKDNLSQSIQFLNHEGVETNASYGSEYTHNLSETDNTRSEFLRGLRNYHKKIK